MLKSFFSSYRYYYIFSTGFVFDFFIKKLIEFLLKHVFIYLSLFFAEKYFIELLTKKNIEYFIYYFSRNNNISNFSFSYFFFYTFLFFISTLNLFSIFYSFL